MRVLSGLQPSGTMHLGNYFGSIKPNFEWLGKADENLFFIVDLHALTTVRNPDDLRKFRRDALLDFLACGFDPAKAIIFYQSDVLEHTELMWILSTLTPMGLLERAVSYKDKVEKGISATAGLFTYPVLMAADILLYDANVVPVGKDQKQHVEMTRDIAIKFNNEFGDTFVIPEPQIREEVAVVPGTDGQKMSKSYGNTIPIFGEEKDIKKAIMSIVTDSREATAPKDPDTTITYQIHKLFLSGTDAAALADEYRNGLMYGEGKKRLFEAYLDAFGPMRAKRAELEKNDDLLQQIAADGAKKARLIAGATMERVKRAVGLIG
ncbi:MAG: tryptophanyl-tRNA synthetase [Candidatus Peribacteria bacterium]|nr:tryptophanyl-tRNA synthetase [Candidatus Peribacteria bacterium]